MSANDTVVLCVVCFLLFFPFFFFGLFGLFHFFFPFVCWSFGVCCVLIVFVYMEVLIV